LIARLLRRGRPAGGSGALATRGGRGNKRFFVWVTFVDMSREEIAKAEEIA
jgi:hypothetical protein